MLLKALDNQPLTMRHMQREDLARVLEIERSAYPIPWSLGVFEDCLKGRNECWVVCLGEQLCAYAIVDYIVDEAHLLNICVSPECARRSLGRTVLKQLISLAISRKCTMFFLEVRVSNKAAIDLYFSEGFNEVGVRRNYYPAENGREDALLMTLELSLDCIA